MEEEVKTEVETEPTPAASEEISEGDEYAADIEPDDEADDSDADEDFEIEYDEDGNVIIDGVTEEEGDTTPQADEEEPEAEPAPTPDPAPTERSAKEPTDTERAYAALRAKAEAALRSMGYKGSIEDGLDQMGAEAAGLTLEQYRENAAAAAAKKAADDAAFRAAFAEKKARDLAAVRAAFPGITYDSVDAFPNAVRFKALRDGGATPEEAFRASHPEAVASQVAAAVKQKGRDSKDHLTSNVPRAARDTSTTVSRADMESYRDMFPGMSDKEIIALHRRANRR